MMTVASGFSAVIQFNVQNTRAFFTRRLLLRLFFVHLTTRKSTTKIPNVETTKIQRPPTF
jgi:hypothetical protein